MIEDVNVYLQYVYAGHKYAYALLVLLVTAVTGVGVEVLTQFPAARDRT